MAQTILCNTIYTSHDIQNKLIEMMSSLRTEEIVREEGDLWYGTIKVDGTRDPTCQENISIVICFVTEHCNKTECLVAIATADKGYA